MSNRNLEAGVRKLMAQPVDFMGSRSTSHSWDSSNQLEFKSARARVLSDPEGYLPNDVVETLEQIADAADDRLGSSNWAMW